MNDTTIKKIYRSLPQVNCKGKCQEACSVALYSKAEEDRLIRRGITPPTFDTDLTCSKLKDGRCSIYENRPYVCRAFGATKAMRCPFGCVPERWIPEELERQHFRALGPMAQVDFLEAAADALLERGIGQDSKKTG